MIECNVSELKKYYGANKIFESISFEIKTGERVGLIGQNGCGKTTLIKILMGMEDYQEGSISIRKGARLGYLEQIHHVEEGLRVEDVLQQAFGELTVLQKRIAELEKQLTRLADEALEKAMKNYGQYLEAYEGLDGYQMETKINRVCQGLEINDEIRNMAFKALSGGEKTRVILAQLLLESPDILLLDEPTNHLDIESIEWLEDFLKDYKGTVMMISHDRYFLDKVTTKILELKPQEMSTYYGNYSAYVVEKERRILEDFRRYQNQQKQIDRMKEQIHRYRVWGAMRDSETMYKRAKELEKRLEKINVLDRPILENRRIRMEATLENRSGKRVISAEGIEKAYGSKSLIDQGGFTVFYQDSICLMGPNGSGKTTLLKLILGEASPDRGSIKLGAGLKIGYLPQQIIFEDEEKTLVQHFSDYHNISQGEARGVLAKMLFMQEDVNKRIKNLSGGEKSRLMLCSLTYEKVNLLLLDEPTNHLDIESREVLEDTLMSYEGTLFFVSHDRYFIEKVADKILSIEAGKLKMYSFGYQSYLEEKKRRIAATNTLPLRPALKEREKNLRLRQPEAESTPFANREAIEREIEELEIKQIALTEEMENNPFDHVILNRFEREREQLNQQINELYEKWERTLEGAEK